MSLSAMRSPSRFLKPPVPGGATELQNMQASGEISPQEAQAAARSRGISLVEQSASRSSMKQPKTPEDPDQSLLDILNTGGSTGKADNSFLAPATAPGGASLVQTGHMAAPHVSQDPDQALMDVMSSNGYSAGGQSSHSDAPKGFNGMPTLEDFVKQRTGGRKVPDPDLLLQTSDSVHTIRRAAPSASEQASAPSEEADVGQLAADSGRLLQSSPQAPIGAAPFNSQPALAALTQVAPTPNNVDLASVTVDEWMKMNPSQVNAAHSFSWHPNNDADTEVSNLLEQVSHLSGKQIPPPTAPSFLQVAATFEQEDEGGREAAETSLAQHAAAALRADLGSTGMGGRLAAMVQRLGAGKGAQMLGALRGKLEARPLTWGCPAGGGAQRAEAALHLTEEGVSLLQAEKSTVAALRAEVRGLAGSSADIRKELARRLSKDLGTVYQAAGVALGGRAVSTGTSGADVASLQAALLGDASAAGKTAHAWTARSQSFVELSAKLEQVETSKASELQRAERVLVTMGAKAADTRRQVRTVAGCAEAAKQAELADSVRRALRILQQ